MSDETFKTRLADHIQDPDFFDSLLSDIEATENSSARFKLKMELLSYIEPKLKNIDNENKAEERTISILFTDAKDPGRKDES